MDGSSRDPNANRDESPCGAGGVHGWESFCAVGSDPFPTLRQAALWGCLCLLAVLADRGGLGPERSGLVTTAECVEENGVVLADRRQVRMIRGYYRRDGTYVRGHYRSRRR